MSKATPNVLKMAGKLANITAAGEQLSESIAEYIARFDKLDKTKAFPQDAMKAFLQLEAILEVAGKAQEAFKAAAINHHANGGQFESGKIAITIKEQSRTTPKWQDEAIEAARQVAILEKITFNKDAFIDAVKLKYPASVSKQVKLVESL